MSVRTRELMSSAFEAWGRWIVRRRWVVAVAVLAVSAACMAPLPSLRVDNSVESFLRSDDPTLIDYNRFRDQFGRDHWVIAVVGPTEVFSQHALRTLKAFHDEVLATAPHTREVTSLVNARWVHSEGDELVIEDLLERWPQTAEDLTALKERTFANPLYAGSLVSRDARFTTLTIRPAVYSSLGEPRGPTGSTTPRYITDVEMEELVAAVRAIAQKHASAEFPVHLAGAPVISERANRHIERDVATSLLLANLFIAALLYAFFRRVVAVALPLCVVLLALLSTLGLMTAAGIPLSAATQILPTLLLVVGIADGVHVVATFYQAVAAGRTRDQAVTYLLVHAGPTLVMTGLITACGLLSFLSADSAQVAHLGIVGPIGVMLAMFYSLTLLPALLMIVPMPRLNEYGSALPGYLAAVLRFFGTLSTRAPLGVVAFWAACVVLAVVGAARLHLSQDAVLWFPRAEPVRVATNLVNEEFDGVLSIELVADTGSPDGIMDPGFLRRLEQLSTEVADLTDRDLSVRKTVSVVDAIKETNQALNEDRREAYSIPATRDAVAQELLLFEMQRPSDLESLVDNDFQRARMSMRVPWTDNVRYPAFIDRVQAKSEEVLGDAAEVRVTGLTKLFSRTFESLVTSLANSYQLELLIITPLMIVLLGSLRYGLLSMIPNIVPVALTLGLMGWLDVPLDIATLLVGNIVISLVMDDTVHFMYHFHAEYAESGDPPDAIRKTLMTIGGAIAFTSLSLMGGFATFLFGHMEHIHWFGMIGVVAIGFAFLAELTLSPALLTLVSVPARETARERAAA